MNRFRNVVARVMAVTYALCLGVVFAPGAKADPPVINSPIDIGPYVSALLLACVAPIGVVLVYKFGWRLFNAVLAFFSGRNRVKV